MLTDEQRKTLVMTAKAAQDWAYTPYSNYKVGAALLTASDRIYDGCNIENAVYPATMCAERTAAFKAVSQGDRQFVAMAVVTRDGGSPCGQCRQVLAEFGLDTLILIADETGTIHQELSIRELLPKAFGPSNLDVS